MTIPEDSHGGVSVISDGHDSGCNSVACSSNVVVVVVADILIVLITAVALVEPEIRLARSRVSAYRYERRSISAGSPRQ
jgi:hypothetical protein